MWNKQDELDFLVKSKQLIGLDNMMIKIKKDYFVYCPKNVKQKIAAPQARNALIGKYTENWCKCFFSPIAEIFNLYAVNNVVCPELGLNANSSADLAFCTSDDHEQKSQNIKLIFEIKMSVTNNYKYDASEDKFEFVGDMDSHKGSPSLSRSDSMLKAIGKSINIRVDSAYGRHIPIVIVGNAPISKNYESKADSLCDSGVIQKFININSAVPVKHIKNSKKFGFDTITDQKELVKIFEPLLKNKNRYFSAMLDEQTLGEFIRLSSLESNNQKRAEKFLILISGDAND